MIPVSEMLNTAVWTDLADVYRVCMMIRSNSKLKCLVVPPDHNCDDYRIVLVATPPMSGASFASMGLIAALCARHDLPADDYTTKDFYGPRFDNFPYFATGLPKERSQAHIAGPVHSVGVR